MEMSEMSEMKKKMMRNPLLRKAEVVYNTSLNILNKDIERKGGRERRLRETLDMV